MSNQNYKKIINKSHILWGYEQRRYNKTVSKMNMFIRRFNSDIKRNKSRSRITVH